MLCNKCAVLRPSSASTQPTWLLFVLQVNHCFYGQVCMLEPPMQCMGQQYKAASACMQAFTYPCTCSFDLPHLADITATAVLEVHPNTMHPPLTSESIYMHGCSPWLPLLPPLVLACNSRMRTARCICSPDSTSSSPATTKNVFMAGCSSKVSSGKVHCGIQTNWCCTRSPVCQCR